MDKIIPKLLIRESLVQVQQGEPKKKHTKRCAFFLWLISSRLNRPFLIDSQLPPTELSEVGRRRAERRRWRKKRGDEVAAVEIQRAKASIEFRVPQESIRRSHETFYSELRFDGSLSLVQAGQGKPNKIRFRKKADFCLYYSFFIIHYSLFISYKRILNE